MFKNYLKIAWRTGRRQKIYSVINVIGLAVGLSASLILFFYVRDDLTYDRFHEHFKSIYRVTGNARSALNPGPLIPASIEEIPEVATGARLTMFGRIPIQRANKAQEEEGGQNAPRVLTLATDPGFFDVFSFKILKGDPSSMKTPNGVFLTPDIASVLFGEDDPIGQPLLFRAVENAYVAAIVEAPPTNSHIQYEAIIRLRVEQNPVWWDSWLNASLAGYVRLRAGAEPAAVEEKMTKLAHDHGHLVFTRITLQPLKDIHLRSIGYAFDTRNFGKSDISIVYLLGTAGLIILLIASINFINLSSARAATRAREVGLRKVIGSQRGQLITQFLGESIFITLIAMCIAGVILQLALPHFARLLGKTLEVNLFQKPMLQFALLATAVVIGILSGLYPAFVLSAFKPVRILRGELKTGRAGILMRRAFIVFQFAVTIALFVGVSIVIIQIRYVQSCDFGYNRENVLVVPDYIGKGDDLLKMKVLDMSGVLSAGKTSYLPTQESSTFLAFPQGKERETSKFSSHDAWIDEGFFDTLDIPIVQGRNFSRERVLDLKDAVVVNEAAAKKIDLDNPLDKTLMIEILEGGFEPKKVIGVVKDFQFASARRTLRPLVFRFSLESSSLLLMRIDPGQSAQIISQIESAYRELFPNRNFRYFFMDDIFNGQFVQDRQFVTRLGVFSGVAIFIACLGLVGMVAFSVEERRKEIAIRKVLGGSEARIIGLLGSDFLKWVALANVIAWPLGYFGMNRWLSRFAYRVPFTIWPFVMAGVCALAIAILTMFYQSIKAARANPAVVLRHEK